MSRLCADVLWDYVVVVQDHGLNTAIPGESVRNMTPRIPYILPASAVLIARKPENEDFSRLLS